MASLAHLRAVLVKCFYKLAPYVRPAAYHSLAGGAFVGFIDLVSVCLDSSAIATYQFSCRVTAARAHVVVKVHVTAYGVPYCPRYIP